MALPTPSAVAVESACEGVAPSVSDEVIAATERFVRGELSGTDASHDFQHVERVRANARLLARLEGLSPSALRLVDLAALLHDVRDYKYSGSEGATAEAVQAFLSQQGVDPETISSVLYIISRVGFKEELAKGAQAGPGVSKELSLEAAIVQDADRLDAIGAIGIARCFTFGGAKHRVLHDPAVPPREGLSKEQYVDSEAKPTTINHFYEKLLKLKGLMKTAAGQQIAAQRHGFMESFLEQFHAEWQGSR